MNGDGRVDETELRHILQSAYPSITDLNVNCLFNQVDVKRRGAVTYGETVQVNKSSELIL